MNWSKYNFLFQSPKYGGFLYNSLSNSLVELDREVHAYLEEVRDDPGRHDPEARPELHQMMLDKKILTRNGDEEKALNLRRYVRDRGRHDINSLGLTIAPTLACNFRCPYCVQHQERSPTMSQETIGKLVDFVKRQEHIRNLHVTWFGGEPLLAFRQVGEITGEFKKLDVPYSAGMITNGYLLTREKVEKLADWDINFIQITLDGPEELHDRRRILAGGGPTFQTILKNVDLLMELWKGRCSIRVNLDKSNMDAYPDLRAFLQERYRGRNLEIYCHYVFNSPATNPDVHCQLDIPEWTDFTLGLFKDKKIIPRDSLFPNGRDFCNCVANSRSGYVIGPEGEVYKCWEDVGNVDRVVGDITRGNGNFITNPELVAMYAVGVDPYEDPECRDCALLPVCSGSCPFFRMQNKYHGGDFDVCVRFKERLQECLELYYDTVMNRVIADFILRQEGGLVGENGFRVISDIRFKKKENESKPGDEKCPSKAPEPSSNGSSPTRSSEKSSRS